jgi:hypothetical protein
MALALKRNGKRRALPTPESRPFKHPRINENPSHSTPVQTMTANNEFSVGHSISSQVCNNSILNICSFNLVIHGSGQFLYLPNALIRDVKIWYLNHLVKGSAFSFISMRIFLPLHRRHFKSRSVRWLFTERSRLLSQMPMHWKSLQQMVGRLVLILVDYLCGSIVWRKTYWAFFDDLRRSVTPLHGRCSRPCIQT